MALYLSAEEFCYRRQQTPAFRSTLVLEITASTKSSRLSFREAQAEVTVSVEALYLVMATPSS